MYRKNWDNVLEKNVVPPIKLRLWKLHAYNLYLYI